MILTIRDDQGRRVADIFGENENQIFVRPFGSDTSLAVPFNERLPLALGRYQIPDVHASHVANVHFGVTRPGLTSVKLHLLPGALDLEREFKIHPHRDLEQLLQVYRGNEIRGREKHDSLPVSTRIHELGIGFLSASATHECTKPPNEDRVLILPDDNFFTVIDGMGGHLGGVRAAEITAKALAVNPHNIKQALKKAKSDMEGEAISNPAEFSVKSGGVVAGGKIIERDGKKYFQGFSVGDAKYIILKKDGRIIQSKENSLVQELVEIGQITEDQALYNNWRNVVTNSIRPCNDFRLETREIEIESGDVICVYSDGIGDNLTPDEIQRIILGKDIDQATEDVCRIAQNRMVNKDLITENGSFDRSTNSTYPDGFRSKPKGDNASIFMTYVN